jgi:quercetin dioxygenase-like cupin family protein
VTVMPNDNRRREPPAQRFAGDEQLIDPRAVARELIAEHPPASAGHRQKTLYKHGDATIALFVFEPGGSLPAHKAAGAVTIQVIDGELRVQTPQAVHTLTAGQLLLLSPDVEHDVTAGNGRTTMLLHVHLE